jgi:hypothetical protein
VGTEVLLPRQALVEQGVLVAGPAPAPHHREVVAELLGEPGPGLGPERLVLVGEPQIHGGSVPRT